MTNLSLSGYRIHEKIGEGAMSEVYRAEDAQGQLVAIKVLRSFFKDNEKYLARLRQEAVVLKRLQDERIVRCYEIRETDDGRLALVQALIQGKNLDEVLKEDERPRAEVGAVVVSEILLGLEEAHRQGVIHRDLKPENIMLTPEGRLKITDFGVAKNLESHDMTITGMVLGSPAYMAPEQIEGKDVDERTDLFGLGVLLYKMCTGQLPFKGSHYSALSMAILKESPAAPENLNPHVHPELAKIIFKSLQKDPKKRYQKAYEFRYDLMKYLDLLEMPSPQLVLRDLYHHEDKQYGAQEGLTNTLMRRAEVAFEEGETQKAVLILRQVLNLNPVHEKAKTMLMKSRVPTYLKYRHAILALLLIFTVASAKIIPTFFTDESIEKLGSQVVSQEQEQKDRETPQPTPAAEPTVAVVPTEPPAPSEEAKTQVMVSAEPTPEAKRPEVKKPEEAVLAKIQKKAKLPKKGNLNKAKANPVEDHVNTGAAAIQRGGSQASPFKAQGLSINEMKVNPLAQVGQIRFLIDENIEVYLDGKLLPKANNRIIEVNAGTHLIELRKEGFAPIRNTIFVPEGEMATINTRPN